MARRLLPAGPRAAPRARVRVAPALLDRDQRDLLLAAAPRELRAVGRRDPGRFRLLGERAALHHAYPPAPRAAGAARELLRVGPAAARAQAGPDPLAAASELQVRAAASRGVPGPAAALDGGRGPDGAGPRSVAVRPGLDPRRGGPSAAARARGPPRVLSDAGIRRDPAPAGRRARDGRHGGQVAFLRRADGGFLLRPAARRRGAVHERLHAVRAAPVGAADPVLVARRPRRVRVLRQRREGPRAVRRDGALPPARPPGFPKTIAGASFRLHPPQANLCSCRKGGPTWNERS